jgi:hypothetical protein
MGGGLLQLVAYGAQDAYITANPQITFWKGLYKRHTNFAMEPFRVNLTGQAGWGVKHSAVISRHADLLYSTYIEVIMPSEAVVNCDQGRLGYNLIKYVELDIGGQVIDRLYGEWLFLWDSLTSDYATSTKTAAMVNGGLPGAGSRTVPTQNQCNPGSGKPSNPTVVYIPLYFFFTKNPGAALPLIALQYHEVKLNIQWSDAKFVAGNFNNVNALAEPVQASVYIDYIYLDVEERRRMAQQSHEYLIEQTQYNEDKGISSYNNRIDLTFNHPVKELVWVVQPNSHTNCGVSKKFGQSRLEPFTYGGYSSSGGRVEAVYEQWIQINGQDRLDRRYGDYYRKVQAYQHHTGMGELALSDGVAEQLGLYMYSFALRPEEHQPSGTCNFSRIDTATIVINLNGAVDINETEDKTYDVRVYAINYNILRIMSGMAGLAYSN